MNRIRKRDLLLVLFRSFYIQGAWNYERMIGLGMCFCLIPIARRICNSDEEYRKFLERHLDFFNAHPYMASFALGSLTKIEELAAFKKWDDMRAILVFKERLCGPLGAIGDNLFWKLLMPLSAMLGAVISILFGWIGIITMLVIYNSIHLSIRIAGIYKGYKKGFDIIRDLSIRGTQRYIRRLQNFAAFVAGLTVAVFAIRSIDTEAGYAGGVVFVISFGTTLLLSIPRKLSIEMCILIILSIAITLGLMIQ